MSMPSSYVPMYSKYFLLMANNPPAIVGDLNHDKENRNTEINSITKGSMVRLLIPVTVLWLLTNLSITLNSPALKLRKYSIVVSVSLAQDHKVEIFLNKSFKLVYIL